MNLGTTTAGGGRVDDLAVLRPDATVGPAAGWRDGLKRIAAPAGLGLVAGFFLAVATGATHAGGDVRTAFLLTGAAILVTGISVFSSWAVSQWTDHARRRRRAAVAGLHVARLRTLLLELETLLANPRFAAEPLQPGTPCFEAARSVLRRIAEAAEVQPDFEDLVDSPEDLDMLERARWAFQDARLRFRPSDAAAQDPETLARWLDATLREEEAREDLLRGTLVPLIHHLDATEHHLAARAAG
jgi:hypothetical protein